MQVTGTVVALPIIMTYLLRMLKGTQWVTLPSPEFTTLHDATVYLESVYLKQWDVEIEAGLRTTRPVYRIDTLT